MNSSSIQIKETLRFSFSELTSLVIILITAFAFIAVDLINDFITGATWVHLVLQSFVGVIITIAMILALKKSYGLQRLLKDSTEENKGLRLDAELWQFEAKKHLEGLSSAIDEQMDRWALTAAEKEVARLLLKGLSLKEIAAIRFTAEKTTRTQSASIYQKSGLVGRSELAAFFLEDLLSPKSSALQRIG